MEFDQIGPTFTLRMDLPETKDAYLWTYFEIFQKAFFRTKIVQGKSSLQNEHIFPVQFCHRC